ncbi:MAG: hypothetical protein NTW87_06550 [Planctomycetota bacterium]|nr:hypothetical protein [Planctomycetota bacterium]
MADLRAPFLDVTAWRAVLLLAGLFALSGAAVGAAEAQPVPPLSVLLDGSPLLTNDSRVPQGTSVRLK